MTEQVSSPVAEAARLAALHRSGILDTPPEQAFDDLVRLAAELLEVPMAAIHLVDADRQWGKSELGLGVREMPRDIAFCPQAMLEPQGLVVPDASMDPRFSDNALVTGAPSIRFYAGMPLEFEGQPIGALCVIDSQPHPAGLTERQRFILSTLAAQVSSQIALRRAVTDRDAVIADRHRILALQRQTLDSASDHAIISTDLEGLVTGWNLGAQNVLGWSREEMLGQFTARIFTPEDRQADRLGIEMRDALRLGRAGDERWHLRKDGSRFWASGELTPLVDDDGLPIGFVKVMRDRTGQHEAGQRLAESEERYRTLFEAVDAGFCIVELKFDEAGSPVDYRIIEGNPAFERMTGLRNASGRWVSDLAPGLERHWFETYGTVALTGEPARFENGAAAFGRWYDVHALRVGDPAAHRVGILFNDISDRRRMELALQQSEAHWRGLFERLQEGIILGQLVRDPAGRVVDWRYLDVNPAWGDLLGVAAGSATGRTIREVFPDIEESWVEEMGRVVDTGQSATFTRQVGSLNRWYEGRAHRIDAERFVVIFLEVTERRQAEERRVALLELSDQFRDMQDPAEMSFVAARIIGHVLGADRVGYSVMRDGDLALVERDWTAPGVNSVAGEHRLREYGSFVEALARGETVAVADSQTDPRTAPAADRLQSIDVRALLNLPLLEQSQFVAFLFVTSRQVRHWTEEDIAFAQNVAERTRVAIERRRAQIALRELNASLENLIQARTSELLQSEELLRQSQKMDAVGQLTGGIAHDFNNLLAGITGSLELLASRLAQGRVNDLGRFIAAASASAERAAALTHRLLAFSRRQTLDPRPTAMSKLVHGMEEMIRRTIGPAIELRVEGAGGLWTVLCDQHQLENALLNLCINARDAMPGGGRLTIGTQNARLDSPSARLRDLPPGAYVALCVTDTGSGMPPEVASRAFEPFYTTKPIGQGTGLGLSMVYGFARQSGGQVHIDSEVGHGTTIRIYLPRYYGIAQDLAAERSSGPALPVAVAQETVLVVDDEPTVRMLISEVLNELGYVTIEAGDGAAGLTVLQSAARVDLLVTDVGLPGGMNGRQLADAARTGRPELRVLFITGYAENALVGDGALEEGMQIMTKPFSMEALALRIRDMIAN